MACWPRVRHGFVLESYIFREKERIKAVFLGVDIHESPVKM